MNEQDTPASRNAPAAYPIVKALAWVVLALSLLSIGYIGVISFINWDAISV